MRFLKVAVFGEKFSHKVFKTGFRDEEMVEEKEETKEGKKVSGKPSWIKLSGKELEDIVVELAKSGKSPAQIGLVLRDVHGIPSSKLLGKKITDILRERKIVFMTDKDVVDKKIETLKAHSAKHKHDYTSSRALSKRLWDLYKLEKVK